MIGILFPFHFLILHFNLKAYIHAKKGAKNKMVSTRFNVFCYAIIFMSLHFVAYSLQDIEKTMMSRNKFDEEGAMLSRPEKETLKAVYVTSEVQAVKGGVIGDRKMAKMTIYKEHINGEETAWKKASSSSNENLVNDAHKPHKRSNKVDHDLDDHQVDVKGSSTFMVINADYHVPRSHPPKNN